MNKVTQVELRLDSKIIHLACERDFAHTFFLFELSANSWNFRETTLPQAKCFILGYAHTLKGRFWEREQFPYHDPGASRLAVTQ